MNRRKLIWWVYFEKIRWDWGKAKMNTVEIVRGTGIASVQREKKINNVNLNDKTTWGNLQSGCRNVMDTLEKVLGIVWWNKMGAEPQCTKKTLKKLRNEGHN